MQSTCRRKIVVEDSVWSRRSARIPAIIWRCATAAGCSWIFWGKGIRFAQVGIGELAPHGLRLCRAKGGELEQIQFLLGHESILTTERYLGSEQDLKNAQDWNYWIGGYDCGRDVPPRELHELRFLRRGGVLARAVAKSTCRADARGRPRRWPVVQVVATPYSWNFFASPFAPANHSRAQIPSW